MRATALPLILGARILGTGWFKCPVRQGKLGKAETVHAKTAQKDFSSSFLEILSVIFALQGALLLPKVLLSAKNVLLGIMPHIKVIPAPAINAPLGSSRTRPVKVFAILRNRIHCSSRGSSRRGVEAGASTKLIDKRTTAKSDGRCPEFCGYYSTHKQMSQMSKGWSSGNVPQTAQSASKKYGVK